MNICSNGLSILTLTSDIVLCRIYSILLFNRSAPASVRKARERTLAVKGVQLFNLLPTQLRNSEHGDVEMFKNHLDIYISNIPDQPTTSGLVRGAQTNSLLHQVPLYECSTNLLF